MAATVFPGSSVTPTRLVVAVFLGLIARALCHQYGGAVGSVLDFVADILIFGAALYVPLPPYGKRVQYKQEPAAPDITKDPIHLEAQRVRDAALKDRNAQ